MQHYRSDWKNNRAFDCYRTYIALKRHFTSKSYDYFRYNGKVNVSISSFERRSDVYQFNQLSKRSDWRELLLANLLENTDLWVGDLLTEQAHQNMLSMQKRRSSLLYTYSEELKRSFDNDFDSNFAVIDGQHPRLLRQLINKEISLETTTILNVLLNFVPAWDKRIQDSIVWPAKRLLIVKYQPFLKVEKDKFKKKTLDIFDYT